MVNLEEDGDAGPPQLIHEQLNIDHHRSRQYPRNFEVISPKSMLWPAFLGLATLATTLHRSSEVGPLMIPLRSISRVDSMGCPLVSVA
ncbi:hypothetical protein ACIA6E_30145 [Streptomyces sp. NPDC051815]|uniref:hypothetical protein n=1 Tax=Streptomyces sp. NPDC051815 TaxID=3365674 RepID=UPI00379BE049